MDVLVPPWLRILHNTFMRSGISILITIKSNHRSFFNSVENILCPPLSCMNLRIDDLCKKTASASIPLVVLDNFYKLNCFFLVIFFFVYIFVYIFRIYIFPLHCSFITVCLLSRTVHIL